MKKTRSEFECYCGFKNKIVFIIPTVIRKSWLEQDCLSCGARYDLRIYPDFDNKEKLMIHKRVIVMSDQVLSAIKASSEKSAEDTNTKGVLSGEEARKRDNDRTARTASKSYKAL